MLSETISMFLTRLHPAWHSDALCREYSELSWFPERGASALEQGAICARCNVAVECAAAAMATPASEDHGICAGTSPGLRKRLRTEGKTPDLEFIAAAVAIEVVQHERRNALRAGVIAFGVVLLDRETDAHMSVASRIVGRNVRQDLVVGRPINSCQKLLAS